MYLIVGLGNPGEKYVRTRHNVGFMMLDRIVKRVKSVKLKVKSYSLKFKVDKKLKAEICELKIGNERIILAKPMTFMNNSGPAAKKITRRYSLDARRLIIIHDDLDIPLGKYKIQFGKGPREHKGVESVERALGSKEFWRVRVGIENRKEKLINYQINQLRIKGKKISGEEYVLQEFSEEEKRIIDQVILEVGEEIKKRINLF